MDEQQAYQCIMNSLKSCNGANCPHRKLNISYAMDILKDQVVSDKCKNIILMTHKFYSTCKSPSCSLFKNHLISKISEKQ